MIMRNSALFAAPAQVIL